MLTDRGVESNGDAMSFEHRRGFLRAMARVIASARILAEADVSDLAQEVLIDAYRAAEAGRYEFRDSASERAWLLELLRHKVIDVARRLGRRVELRTIDRVFDSVSRTLLDIVDPSAVDPADAAIANEAYEVMCEVLEREKEHRRRALRMTTFYGASNAEAAEAFGRDEATTRRWRAEFLDRICGEWRRERRGACPRNP